MDMALLFKFQKDFLAGCLDPEIDTAALSVPRGNGKSWLAGHLVSRILNPSDKLFAPGTESVLFSGSIEQCRIVFRFARKRLEPLGGYRFVDSATRVAITHKATGTRLRVIGSNAKTSFGLVDTPFAICDEPGAWETNGGTLLYDAIATAQGKPGSPLKAVFIGTLAPAKGGWWHTMIETGTHGSTYVQSLQGDRDKWDQWEEIQRCNPLSAIDENFKRKLLEERDAALADSRLKARFFSYRLNIPSADESELLLTVDDWQKVSARPIEGRTGRPIVGLDLGAHRAWSAALAIWPNGRTEAIAVAPGIPDIREQEKRDRVPEGMYQKLVDKGLLQLAANLRVPPPSLLINWVREKWGVPHAVVCDRFRLAELRDCSLPCELISRVARWSDASFDIRALRKIAKDGPLSVTEESRPLILASLSAALVENDKQGSMRLIKRGTENAARDDVAAAFTLAAGEFERRRARPAIGTYGGLV